MNPIKIALIGAGLYTRDVHIPALLELADRFEVVAIGSRTPESAQLQAQRFSGDVFVTTNLAAIWQRADVEAVLITLPIPLLAWAIEAALKSGKHILSEKPIAADLAAANTLLKMAADHPQLVWMVGEQWRYEDAFMQAADLIQQGKLGQVVLAQSAVFNSFTPANKYYHTPWRRDGSIPGGFIVDGGVHRTAALRLLLGEVQSVSAIIRQMRADLPPADTFSANLMFENGIIGSFSTTYAAGVWTVQPTTIVGTDGTLRVEREILELTVNGGQPELLPVEANQGTRRQYIAFADAIRNQTPHRNTPQEAWRDLAILEAMFASASSGKTVDVSKLAEVDAL